ncbi:hypothetical protein EVAR_24940_1 [Eumeta japonica]|uniref:Uncharacterized protein n=1 Tax=Eumeta variegata TaxID=151549 RepID=A0A4C2A2Q8_EUMVA|nr:hypothetical protein EVAR_24940_1 [Eumeta japonica]
MRAAATTYIQITFQETALQRTSVGECVHPVREREREKERERDTDTIVKSSEKHPRTSKRQDLMKTRFSKNGVKPIISRFTKILNFRNEKLKKDSRKKWFTHADEAVAAYDKAVEATPKCEWTKCFSRWFNRMQRVVDLNVDYFERQ